MSAQLAYAKHLRDELAERIDRNPRYSLRAFAKALRIGAGTLSQILSGKRLPSYKAAQKLLNHLDLEPNQRDAFLKSLAEAHRNRGLKKIGSTFERRAAEADQKENRILDLNLDLFKVIGDWYHYAILMITFVEGFKSQPKWIANQLGLSEIQVVNAIQRLKNLEMLIEEDGVLRAWESNWTSSDKHITTPALRRHTQQILEKAIESNFNDPIEARNITAMTMAINPLKLPEAKLRIQNFMNELTAYLEQDNRSHVYEMSICLFPLQKLGVEMEARLKDASPMQKTKKTKSRILKPNLKIKK